jgi:hypothetical protein
MHNTNRFAPGQIVATPGALAAVGNNALAFTPLLARHLSGDWGDMGYEDKAANNAAVRNGERVMSVYTVANAETGETSTVWFITEWDRSVTTILLPSEY